MGVARWRRRGKGVRPAGGASRELFMGLAVLGLLLLYNLFGAGARQAEPDTITGSWE